MLSPCIIGRDEILLVDLLSSISHSPNINRKYTVGDSLGHRDHQSQHTATREGGTEQSATLQRPSNRLQKKPSHHFSFWDRRSRVYALMWRVKGALSLPEFEANYASFKNFPEPFNFTIYDRLLHSKPRWLTAPPDPSGAVGGGSWLSSTPLVARTFVTL